jgi:hypothetical protein
MGAKLQQDVDEFLILMATLELDDVRMCHPLM